MKFYALRNHQNLLFIEPYVVLQPNRADFETKLLDGAHQPHDEE